MAETERDIGLDEVAARIERLIALDDAVLAANGVEFGDDLLALGEAILERWLMAQGRKPTRETAEGFRLLALHRQGARGEPSLNACRETCRELVYHRNLLHCGAEAGAVPRRVRLGAMVARHLALFVAGKLEVAGLGEFCCSSRPLRALDAARSRGEPMHDEEKNPCR